nr:hypothetical protein [Escherichia coli]
MNIADLKATLSGSIWRNKALGDVMTIDYVQAWYSGSRTMLRV